MHQPEQHEVHAQQAELRGDERQAQAVRRRVGEARREHGEQHDDPEHQDEPSERPQSHDEPKLPRGERPKHKQHAAEHRVECDVERDAPVEPLPREPVNLDPRGSEPSDLLLQSVAHLLRHLLDVQQAAERADPLAKCSLFRARVLLRARVHGGGAAPRCAYPHIERAVAKSAVRGKEQVPDHGDGPRQAPNQPRSAAVLEGGGSARARGRPSAVRLGRYRRGRRVAPLFGHLGRGGVSGVDGVVRFARLRAPPHRPARRASKSAYLKQTRFLNGPETDHAYGLALRRPTWREARSCPAEDFCGHCAFSSIICADGTHSHRCRKQRARHQQRLDNMGMWLATAKFMAQTAGVLLVRPVRSRLPPLARSTI